MDTLPPEVLRLICIQLRYPQTKSSFHDLANLRFLNRSLGLVGCEFLITRIRFHTSYKSLQRLEQISEHPVFCRTVQSLVYEAALLADVACRRVYASHFELDHHGLEKPREPSSPCSERERRYYVRSKAKWTRSIYAKYAKYRSLYDSQRSLLENDVLEHVLARCVPRFFNLTYIEVDPIRRCTHLTSRRFVEEFGSECASPLSGNSNRISDQLQYVFLPNNVVNRTLRKLEVESLSPSFFQTGRNGRLQAAFTNLTDIDIMLKLVDGDIIDDERPEEAFQRHLMNNVLTDALSAAECLRNLSIGIDQSHTFFVNISNLVPSRTWEQLSQITLNSLSSTQAAFIDFLKGQPNLRTLSVSMMQLTDGNWSDLLILMHEQLRLRSFEPIGFLEDSQETWLMDLINVHIYRETFDEFTVAQAIDLYVTDHCRGPDEFFPHPLLEDFDNFEDADLVRDMFGSLSDLDEMSMDSEIFEDPLSPWSSPMSESSNFMSLDSLDSDPK